MSDNASRRAVAARCRDARVNDDLGRKVAELVNGQVAEGYHTATWNAGDVASGVHFARFIATDGNGLAQLNKVVKLLLAK